MLCEKLPQRENKDNKSFCHLWLDRFIDFAGQWTETPPRTDKLLFSCVWAKLTFNHPIKTVRPNGPKIRQKCIFDQNFLGVQLDFCQKSHKWANFSLTKYLIWQFMSYNVLNLLKTLINYNASWYCDILNDHDMIIDCYVHVQKISFSHRNGP